MKSLMFCVYLAAVLQFTKAELFYNIWKLFYTTFTLEPTI